MILNCFGNNAKYITHMKESFEIFVNSKNDYVGELIGSYIFIHISLYTYLYTHFFIHISSYTFLYTHFFIHISLTQICIHISLTLDIYIYSYL